MFFLLIALAAQAAGPAAGGAPAPAAKRIAFTSTATPGDPGDHHVRFVMGDGSERKDAKGAPPLAVLKDAAAKRGAELVDATAIVTALFGDGKPSALLAGTFGAPPSSLPKPVAADWVEGARSCKGWKPAFAKTCGLAVAHAAWERWLERERFALVVEASPGSDPLRLASYRPGDRHLRLVATRDAVSQAVGSLLDEQGAQSGSRPNSNRLPGPTPPADNLDFAKADLPPMEPPAGCTPPASLSFGHPPNGLEAALAALYLASVARAASSVPKPLECAVTLEPAASVREESGQRPGLVQLNCGAIARGAKLYPSDDLSDPELQKVILLELGRFALDAACFKPRRIR